MLWKPKEEHKIGRRLGDYLYGLENGELQGLVFLTELCEQYGCYRIKSENTSHVHYARLVSGIAKKVSYRPCKCYHQRKKSRTDTEDGDKGAGIDLLRIHSLLICKTEASRLKTENKNYLKDSDIRHEFRYHSIAFRCQKPGVYGNKKKVYDAGKDGAQTINDGLSCQLFQGICHNERKISYFCRVKA